MRSGSGRLFWGRPGGAGGACGVGRGGVVSKSATKAPRVGIGGEEKRGISTFLLVRSGPIGAFVADLDNWRLRGVRGAGTAVRADHGLQATASDEKGSMSLSHQNRRLRDGDRRDGAGRMGAEWVWRA